MFRSSVLLCALLFSAPSLWQALGDQTISLEVALVRLLIALPVSAILLGLLRLAVTNSRPRGSDSSADGQELAVKKR